MEAINESKLRDRTVVIVTSDHGGINKDHGGHSIEEIDTPFIVYGHGIKRGYDIESIMMQYDVAVTIAGLLGIIPPNIWRGRYVDSIVDCVNTSIYLPSYEMNVSRISHQFFDTNGIPHSNEPQNGIVIRREIMSDGITKSTKYLKNR